VGYCFEFDAVNNILLLRVDGRLTDELLAECYEAIRTRSIATDARAGIFDFTALTDFPVSAAFVRRLASKNQPFPKRPYDLASWLRLRFTYMVSFECFRSCARTRPLCRSRGPWTMRCGRSAFNPHTSNR
jgi:hypothetical protein